MWWQPSFPWWDEIMFQRAVGDCSALRPPPWLAFQFCTGGVEVWRGGLGGAYLLPTLSSVGASLAPPCFRFHTPLIEPDVRICRIRLSEKTHAIAVAIACDAVCNF